MKEKDPATEEKPEELGKRIDLGPDKKSNLLEKPETVIQKHKEHRQKKPPR